MTNLLPDVINILTPYGLVAIRTGNGNYRNIRIEPTSTEVSMKMELLHLAGVFIYRHVQIPENQTAYHYGMESCWNRKALYFQFMKIM